MSSMLCYESFEKEIIKNLKDNFRLNVEEACFATDYLPKHIILDRTRNIHSYIVFSLLSGNHFSGRYFPESEGLLTSLVKLLRTQFSSLDRPLFIVLTNQDQQVSCIEGNFVREFLLERDRCKNVQDFLLNESEGLEMVVSKIKKEL